MPSTATIALSLTTRVWPISSSAILRTRGQPKPISSRAARDGSVLDRRPSGHSSLSKKTLSGQIVDQEAEKHSRGPVAGLAQKIKGRGLDPRAIERGPGTDLSGHEDRPDPRPPEKTDDPGDVPGGYPLESVGQAGQTGIGLSPDGGHGRVPAAGADVIQDKTGYGA
jgi:hypothetical protein